MPTNQAAVESLRWKKFPVLSDGFITLVDVMGDDQSVVQAARVSYGNDNPKWVCNDCFGVGYHRDGESTETCGCNICKGHGYLDKKGQPWKENDAKADRHLIRHLMRHHHTTPFEMAEVKILIRIPMDAWRQMIRHRTASVNEYSTRYTEAIDSMDATPPDQWRLQSDSNKQGSAGLLTEWPEGVTLEPAGRDGDVEVKGAPIHYIMPARLVEGEMTPGHLLSLHEEKLHAIAEDVYQQRLKFGVAREQARKDLPLSTYTEAYWKIDLKNLLGFLRLRMDGHAQKEIRDYATIIGEQIVKPLFPMVWEAFEDYQLNSMELTRLDIGVIGILNGLLSACNVCTGDFNEWLKSPVWYGWPEEWRGLAKCRERDECIAKLKKLGLIAD